MHSCSISKQIILRCLLGVFPSVPSQPSAKITSRLLHQPVLVFPYIVVFFCGCFCQFSFVDMDQPIFQPYPSELVFQNFTPTQTYSLQLNLFNNDKVCKELPNVTMGKIKHSL